MTMMARSLKYQMEKAVVMPITYYIGLQKLPNESLAEIFMMDEPDAPRPEKLQLVCKRFAYVINNHAAMWSYVLNMMPLQKITEHFRRSESNSLRSELSLPYLHRQENFIEIVEAIAQHSNR